MRPALPGSAMPKIDALVEVAAEVYRLSEPTRGAQVIFCDLATPKPKA